MAKVITMITGELGFENIFSLSYDVEDPKTTTPVINFPIAYVSFSHTNTHFTCQYAGK